ncbi:MAG: NAD-binding protein [Actinobacteria bacterium]|nr:NAD-binding protein [Actinomycetota bacterium]
MSDKSKRGAAGSAGSGWNTSDDPYDDVDDDGYAGTLHQPERKLSPGAQVGVRALVALGCLAAATLVTYIGRDGYADASGQPITLLSALYYATVSLSTTGYGDIAPVTPEARLINVVLITPLRVLFLIVLVGTTIEVLTRRTRELYSEKRWRNKVDHHNVVIGFGVKGRSAVNMLLQSGERAKQIVVVSTDPLAVQEATRMGVMAVLGDARRDDILRQAEIAKADNVILATDADDTTVLITLSVKRLNPRANVIAAAREASNSDLIKASGATTVIPTAEASGQLMGMATVAPQAGAFMEDLLDPTKGLEVAQRPATRDEIGLAPAQLRERGQIALAVIRNGTMYRFDEPGVKVLQRGDQLIVIGQSRYSKENPTSDGRGAR